MYKLLNFLVLLSILMPVGAQAEKLLFVTLDNTPQAYFEGEQVTGFLTEIVNEAARRAGYQSQVKIVPWKRALGMTEKGLADAVFNAGYNFDREKYLRYSKTVLMTEKVVAIKKTGTSFYLGYDLKEAEGLRVGVGRGFFYGNRIQEAIEQKKFRRIEEVPNIDQNIKKLLLGRIDIFFGDYYPVMRFLSDQGLLDEVEFISDNKTAAPIIYAESETYLAFSRKKSTIPFVRVNSALEEMKRDGTYDSIIMKYMPHIKDLIKTNASR